MFFSGTSVILAALLTLAAPSAPRNCNATLSETYGGWVIAVNWRDRSNDEDGFQIEHWTRIDGVWLLAETAQVGVNESSAIFVQFAPQNRFRVRAYNGDGASSWSNWARLNF